MIQEIPNAIIEILKQLAYAWEWKLFFSCVLGTFAFLFGMEVMLPVTALLMLVFFDFIAGSLVAYHEKVYCSKKAMKTAYKILMYGLLISGAHMTDIAMNTHTTFEWAMVGFLAANEMISLMRNANKLGYQTPKRLADTLTQVIKK